MNKEKLIIRDITSSTLTNSDGLSLKIAIDSALSNADVVVLSFEAIGTISSSFLNSSIGEIIDKYGFEILKDRVMITNYTPTIASFIQKYINDLRYTEHK